MIVYNQTLTPYPLTFPFGFFQLEAIKIFKNGFFLGYEFDKCSN